ncbi:hypothetical protein B0H13DRAFT_1853373 [Mycena leptocephala]|nr:hypothetical protein B0H13DRAFT_1853373 [Mycena leptocephala]
MTWRERKKDIVVAYKKEGWFWCTGDSCLGSSETGRVPRISALAINMSQFVDNWQWVFFLMSPRYVEDLGEALEWWQAWSVDAALWWGGRQTTHIQSEQNIQHDDQKAVKVTGGPECYDVIQLFAIQGVGRYFGGLCANPTQIIDGSLPSIIPGIAIFGLRHSSPSYGVIRLRRSVLVVSGLVVLWVQRLWNKGGKHYDRSFGTVDFIDPRQIRFKVRGEFHKIIRLNSNGIADSTPEPSAIGFHWKLDWQPMVAMPNDAGYYRFHRRVYYCVK